MGAWKAAEVGEVGVGREGERRVGVEEVEDSSLIRVKYITKINNTCYKRMCYSDT